MHTTTVLLFSQLVASESVGHSVVRLLEEVIL